MRLLALAPLALMLASTACSGAAPSDLFGPSDGTSDDPITGKDPNGTLPVGTATPAGNGGSATTPTTTDPTTPTDTPTLPTPVDPAPPNNACAIEVEPNDTQNQATPFDACIAGQLSSKQDVDFGTFTVPKTARTVSWKTDGGDVTVRVSSGGMLDIFPITNGGQVQPGTALFARISATSGKPAYAVHFTFN